MRLTLVTTCKAFRKPIATIQRNALESWSRLKPVPEVLVFGDEEGVPEVCQELGFRQLEHPTRNEFGTPLLSGMLASADREARHDILALANADIMLSDEVLDVVARVQAQHERFLVLVRRWNTPLRTPWNFSSQGWQEELRRYVEQHGSLEPAHGGIDVFVYPRGLFDGAPPFAIGRGRWDSWLILHALRHEVPVIDATTACLTVHQDHDYAHLDPDQAEGPPTTAKPSYSRTVEGRRNEALLGGPEFIFTCLNATHRMSREGLTRNIDFHPLHMLRRLATLPARRRWARPLAPLVGLLQPLWQRGGAIHKRMTEAVARRRQNAGEVSAPGQE